MNKESKIYVAGHTGLVGMNTIKELKERGYSNICTVSSDIVDLTSQIETDYFFNREIPDVVINCAGYVGGIIHNSKNQFDALYMNMMISCNLIMNAIRHDVDAFINLGSTCIYPRNVSKISESDLLSGYLEPTNEGYALAKIASTKLTSYAQDELLKNFVTIMPTNLYGPGDNYNLVRSHVVAAIIRKTVLGNAFKEGDMDYIKKDLKKDISLDSIDIKDFLNSHGIYEDRLVFMGDGSAVRDFMHVKDMALIIVYTLELENMPVGYFNVGSGHSLDIRSLLDIVVDIVGYSGKIEFDGATNNNGTPSKDLDLSIMRSLGINSNIRLEEGLRDTINKYKLDM